MDGEPEERNAAVENAHEPGNQQQLLSHAAIVTATSSFGFTIAESILIRMPIKQTSAKGRQRKTARPGVADAGVANSGVDNSKTADSKIGCVIFDLDDTLYDCFGQRVHVTHRYAAQAMVEAGLHTDVEAVYQARMRFFRQDPILRHIDAEVCRLFAAADPEAIALAAREAYFNCPVGKLKLFAGSLPLLRFLAAHE